MTKRKPHPPLALRLRLSLWGGVLAMALQLFLPLGQGFTTNAFSGEASNVSSPLIICEIMGGGQEAPAEDDPGLKFSCPICQLRCLGQGLLLAQPAVAPAPLATAHVWRKTPNTGAAATPNISGNRPRAPPFSA